MIVKTCVNGFVFDACHYTPVNGIPTLHGHTFKLSVCVEGEVGKEGWVVDFSLIKRVVEEAISPFKYSLIMPLSGKGSISIKGNFRVKEAYINAPKATAELIGLEICRNVHKKLKDLGVNLSSIEVTLYEGDKNSARVKC